jgi:hypothetical protein
METVSKQEAQADPAKDLVGTGIDVPGGQEEHDEWTPAQEKAMAGGWKPESEWDGDPEDYVDAPEFNRRGELMARISQLGRKLGESEKAVEKLTAMVSGNEKVTNKLINDQVAAAERRLKAQRREAIRDGDFEAIDEIESDIEELAKTKEAAKDDAPAPAPAPADGPDLSKMDSKQRAWYDLVTGTPWIQHDRAVHDPLLTFGEAYIADNPEAGTADFMGAVVEKAQELRTGKKPSKSRGPRGPDDGKGGTRQGGRPSKSKGGKYSVADLNSQQKAIAAGFVEDGILDSIDEYANLMGKEGHLDSQR